VRKVLAVGGTAVVIALYLVAVASRQRNAGRVLLGLAFGALLVIGALGATAVRPATADLPPTFDAAAVTGSISPVQAGWGVRQPIVLTFSAPMDAASVQAALHVSPPVEVRLAWDASGRRLYVTPVDAWSAGTAYTVTVGAGARSRAGAALEPMLPAVVFVRSAATAELTATRWLGERLALDSGFRLTFSRTVDLASLRDAFTITPFAAGTFAFEASRSAMPALVWVPSEPLLADTLYTVTLGPSAVDVEGAPIADPPSLTARTVSRPAVVRFRPRHKADDVDPQQVLSVRFTEPMDRASARAAYRLFLLDDDGARSEVDLSEAEVSWAEGSTVLVVDPPKALKRGSSYVAEVLGGARSRLGVPLSDDPLAVAAHATFTVATAPTPGPTVRPPGSGGGTPTAPWYDAERYYLDLLNCTRTGGWLAWDGSCPGRGSGSLAPLILHKGVSDCVARPWAKYLAQTNQLYHGDTGGRFAACGYGDGFWAENLTWYTGNVYTGAISSVIFFQNEKGTSYDGHYRNLMDPRATHVGIGIWRIDGKNWYVVDFYGP
jgi:hypothetical protein